MDNQNLNDNQFSQQQSTNEFTPYQGGDYSNNPNNTPVMDYMVLNIVATVLSFLTLSCCCLGGFVGVVGIIFSSKVQSCNKMGDYYGAMNNSKTAKILMIVTFSMFALWFIYFIVSAMNGASTEDIQMILDQIQQMQ